MNKKLIIAFAGVLVILIALLVFFWLQDRAPDIVYAEEVAGLNVETTINNLDFQKLELDSLNYESPGYIESFKGTLEEIRNLNLELKSSINLIEVPDEQIQLHQHLLNYQEKNSQLILLFDEMIGAYETVETLEAEDDGAIRSQYELIIQLMNDIVSISKDAENEKSIWLDGLLALKAVNNN